MSNAEQLVENLLNNESPDDIDPKDMVNVMQAEEEAAEAARQEEYNRLRATGEVSDKSVAIGGTIWHRTFKNSDGTAGRAKVTSIKTWKTRPGDFLIGWKHGMYEYGKITPRNASEFTTVEPPPVPKQPRRRV